MIVNLTHYNIRKTLHAFSDIINNRTWITRNQDLQLGDSSDSNYSFNNITVIRALACNEYKLYYNDEHSIIPNILYNTYEKDYSILCLLILNYFLKRQHPDTLFGINSEKLQFHYIITIFSKIFEHHDKIHPEDVEVCLNYLYKRKVLRKSIYDEDVSLKANCPEILKKHSILYLSSRGYELLYMFENDSVLMELYREDMFRNYEQNSITESSYILMLKRQQIKIFLDLFNIIVELVAEESNYRAFAKENGTLELYYNAFGKESVCKKLVNGIKKSIDYSNQRSSEIDEMFISINESINALESIR